MADRDLMKEALGDEYVLLRDELVDRWEALIARYEYRREGYRYVVGITPGMKYPFVKMECLRPDCETGETGIGSTGKRYPSQYTSDSEFFQMLLNLAIGYEEHEVREFTFVDGKRIYGPHISYEALQQVCDTTDVRS